MIQEKILGMFAIALCLSLTFIAAGPSTTISLIGGNQTTPIYTESKFSPLVFLSNQGGRVLFNNNYFNGNLTSRNGNYIFTGEQIQWTVLVWDKNGVPEKIRDVWAGWVTQNNGPLPPEVQSNCQWTRAVTTGSLASQGFPNVRRPGDQEPQVNGNPQTMGIYTCTLTIEPNCQGPKWFGVQVEDLDFLNGTIQQAESWYCNPAIDLTKSGTINFGTLGPGEQGSSTFSVKNNDEDGSGIQIVLAIAGKDFYDPLSSGGMCPTTNQLKLQGVNPNIFNTGFWYTATQGSNSVSNKRIPYLTSSGVVSADPIFSSGNGQIANWGGTLVPMNSGSSASITLNLGLPQPCNGEFTEGEIDLFGWAL